MLKASLVFALLGVATGLEVGGARADQLRDRPSLIDYNPVANAAAVVLSSDKMARFTVLTPRLVRMEYAAKSGVFEDFSTIAMLNRNLPVPPFTQQEAGGKLTITTSAIVVTYTVGQPFSSTSLSVTPRTTGAFKGWKFDDPSPGNLLGTIRGLDGQNQTPLNCTLNKHILDNGEYNHCEWGIVSRDGWVVYDDSKNYILDANDWWVPIDVPPTPRVCSAGTNGTDVDSSSRSSHFPDGTSATSPQDCCAKCLTADDCIAWVYATDGSSACWPLAGWGGNTPNPDRVFGVVANDTAKTMQNRDAMDLYGFFHGHDYFGALADFVAVSGKTIMVPKYVSGVWWSRWYNLNNLDLVKITEDYGTRAIPLDVFVIDMDWHTKNDWSGFTFDSHLFPYPEDSMAYLHQLGLPVTLNIHDASGVNNWEAMFPALIEYLGLPKTTTRVPFNLINATVTYAVEDIVLGDLLYKKGVDFWWIDWQQGGNQGGLVGDKQNPTMWLNHLRCTDRHRVGDNTRALVLARWGGLGGHRYQVGFSGDVKDLDWANLAYQPYFSATAANVGHGFWSHDIEGPGDDMEMYTRWIQVGAFSGTMRSHDRGMSGGGCADDSKFSCTIVEPWNTPNVNFPDTFMEANRLALQFRAHLLPYVYNGHRAAFDTGVGLIRPMYYHYPELDQAYLMDASGNNVQYMFGPSILFSPVVQAGDITQHGMGPGLATKQTWLPPGTWVDANTGVITTVTQPDHIIKKSYAINQIPLWYQAGAVLPYVPLRSLKTSVGNAARQYTFLGFKIVPGQNGGSVSVYEDDGQTTAYLTQKAYAWTTATYNYTSSSVLSVGISSAENYTTFPAVRSYQIRLLNSPPIVSVTVNGQSITYNRFGKIAATGALPPNNQYYYDFSLLPDGMGPVIDVVNVPTNKPLTLSIKLADTISAQALSGVYGAVTHAIWAKANLDIERTTPGSNKNEPAYTNVLSSIGQALEYAAGQDLSAFASAVTSAPNLLNLAGVEITNTTSSRKSYSLGLLANAML